MATRAREPLIFMRSMRTDCEIILKVGTSFMMRSKVGLSQMTALLALSFTLPFDHFFFLPTLVVFWAPAAAFALFHSKRDTYNPSQRRVS